MDAYLNPARRAWTELGASIRRKVDGHTPALMSALAQFDEDADGTPHAPDVHEQIACVLSRSFEAEVGGVKRVIHVDEVFVANHREMHGVVALAPGSTLRDPFSPPRADDF